MVNTNLQKFTINFSNHITPVKALEVALGLWTFSAPMHRDILASKTKATGSNLSAISNKVANLQITIENMAKILVRKFPRVYGQAQLFEAC